MLQPIGHYFRTWIVLLGGSILAAYTDLLSSPPFNLLYTHSTEIAVEKEEVIMGFTIFVTNRTIFIFIFTYVQFE